MSYQPYMLMPESIQNLVMKYVHNPKAIEEGSTEFKFTEHNLCGLLEEFSKNPKHLRSIRESAMDAARAEFLEKQMTLPIDSDTI